VKTAYKRENKKSKNGTCSLMHSHGPIGKFDCLFVMFVLSYVRVLIVAQYFLLLLLFCICVANKLRIIAVQYNMNSLSGHPGQEF